MPDASDAGPAVPAAPPIVDVQFPARRALLESYAGILATDGVRRGLLGPREVDRLWERHLLNCAVLAPLIEPSAAVADVGSGAGLPGLVLAIVRPDLAVTLIEPLLRRTTFLLETIDRLELPNAVVRRSRAESCPDLFATFDVVTARAVAPLDRLVGWALPLLRVGGRLLALKGANAGAEVAAAGPRLDRLQVRSVTVRGCGQESVDPTTSVVEITAGVSRRPGWRAGGGERQCFT